MWPNTASNPRACADGTSQRSARTIELVCSVKLSAKRCVCLPSVCLRPQSCGRSAATDNMRVDEYIVMPNHVHGIIMNDGEHCFSPCAHMRLPFAHAASASSPPKAGSLSVMVRSFKAGVTRKSNEFASRQAIWQGRFYLHLLRGDKAIAAVREYIR